MALFDQQIAEDYMERVMFNVEEGLFDYQSAEDYTIESLYDHQETDTKPPTQLARGTASPLVGTPSPGAILDSCLARARTLHVKMDKLSAEVSARRDPRHPTLPVDTDQPGGQGSSDKASNLELARDTSASRTSEKHQTFDGAEPASKLQTAADARPS